MLTTLTPLALKIIPIQSVLKAELVMFSLLKTTMVFENRKPKTESRLAVK